MTVKKKKSQNFALKPRYIVIMYEVVNNIPVKDWCHQSGYQTQCPMEKNTSHENEVLPQDTTHLIERPCYQLGSPCQDPAGNPTTRRPNDHHKEMQTAVVWSYLLFSRSGQNHLARYSKRGKKTRQTEDEVGRQHQGMDRPGVRQRAVENRKKWRKLVAKSSVVPKWPSWLRDRWDEMWEKLLHVFTVYVVQSQFTVSPSS